MVAFKKKKKELIKENVMRITEASSMFHSEWVVRGGEMFGLIN